MAACFASSPGWSFDTLKVKPRSSSVMLKRSNSKTNLDNCVALSATVAVCESGGSAVYKIYSWGNHDSFSGYLGHAATGFSKGNGN